MPLPCEPLWSTCVGYEQRWAGNVRLFVGWQRRCATPRSLRKLGNRFLALANFCDDHDGGLAGSSRAGWGNFDPAQR